MNSHIQTLQAILDGICELPKALDVRIHGITLDSRNVKAGDLFIGLAGETYSANRFLDDAVMRGAAAILVEENIDTSLIHIEELGGAVLVKIPGLKNELGKVASRFFGEPSCQLSVIGITGTNGKTSVSHYLAQVLNYLGCKCGVIGTLGYGMPEMLSPASHTTPDVITNDMYLSAMKEQGAESVVMEVSSHGLEQGRVEGITFTGAIFTNLTRDHLDFHETMARYGDAKKLLFTKYSQGFSVINVDDEFGAALASQIGRDRRIIRYGMSEHAELSVIRADYGRYGVRAEIRSPWGDRVIKSKLLGEFNLTNVLAVLGGGLGMGFSLDELIDALSCIEPVPGRMQPVDIEGRASVIIDYAHTPDAIEKALKAARLHCKGELWCVFGCGGDRDKGKRPLMGRMAEKWSDHIIITDDNVRSEAPETITDEILSGMLSPSEILVEHDRAKAISEALGRAKLEDWVLIAGKGHERYQEIKGHRFDYSDYDSIVHILLDVDTHQKKNNNGGLPH